MVFCRSESLYGLYFQYVTFLNLWVTNILILCITLSFLYKTKQLNPILMYLLTFIILHTLSYSTTTSLIPELPKSLLIGTIVLHPTIFYISVVTLYILSSTKCLYSVKQLTGCVGILIVIGMIIALIFGSLWSLQSDVWGYIWVNDLIEWSLFLLIILALWRQHIIFIFSLGISGVMYLQIIFSILFILRLGLFPSRHSFFSFLSLTPYLYILYTIFCAYCLFLNKITALPYSNYIFLFIWLLGFSLNSLLVSVFIVLIKLLYLITIVIWSLCIIKLHRRFLIPHLINFLVLFLFFFQVPCTLLLYQAGVGVSLVLEVLFRDTLISGEALAVELFSIEVLSPHFFSLVYTWDSYVCLSNLKEVIITLFSAILFFSVFFSVILYTL